MMSGLQGRTALVTGASSGLGKDFAAELARRGCNLVLVARREDRLRAVAESLAGRYGVRAETVPADLAADDAPPRLYERTRELGLAVDVLINNAGLGVYGPFLDIPWERERQMLQVDVLAVVQLTKLFLRDMVARNFGYVLMVSSNMAYQPGPGYASYAAAKSFVLSVGESVGYEVRNTGVQVCVLAPGATATEFHRVAGQRPTLYQRWTMMDSAEVARIGVENMLRGRRTVVPGRLNALGAFSVRFVPRRAAAALSALAVRGGSPPARPGAGR